MTGMQGTTNPAFEKDNNYEDDDNTNSKNLNDFQDHNRKISDNFENEPQAIYSPEESTPKEQVRDLWSNPIEFLLSCVALSVGLGNIWRFPAVALANGGGAFLIPYLFVLTFIGRPLYYMELCLGQFASVGSVKIWNLAPVFKGIGYGQTIANFCVTTYYGALMSSILFYFFVSFSSELPWSKCPENSTNCFDSTMNNSNIDATKTLSAAERYYRYEVAKIHENGLDDGIFAPDWRLTLCLLATWIILFCIMAKGVRSSGKAAYFTALFPYVVLLVLLIRGAMLPGAANGILYFFTPQWEKLLKPEVWQAAVGQCFFSLSVGYGSIIVFSSYNSFRHNVYRDALILAGTDTLTSIVAGSITFAIVGYLGQEMGISDLQQVIKDGGTGLAFISYPDVVSRFEWYPQIFAVLFFLMLFTLGTGSAVGLSTGVITVACELFPNYRRRTITLIVCSIAFLIGIVYVTPQGQYVITLVDILSGDTVIYILAIFEIVTVQYIYGYKRFFKDIEFMLNRKTGFFWKMCWVFLTPILLTVILIYSFIEMKAPTKGNYVFGKIAIGCTIGLGAAIISTVPIFIIKYCIKYESTGLSKSIPFWKGVFKPSPKWGPSNPEIKKEYDQFIRQEFECNESMSTYRKNEV